MTSEPLDEDRWVTCYYLYLNGEETAHICVYESNRLERMAEARQLYQNLIRSEERQPGDEIILFSRASRVSIRWVYPGPTGQILSPEDIGDTLKPLDLPFDTVFYWDYWYDEHSQHVPCFRYWDKQKGQWVQISVAAQQEFIAWRDLHLNRLQNVRQEDPATARRLIESTDPEVQRKKHINDTARRILKEVFGGN